MNEIQCENRTFYVAIVAKSAAKRTYRNDVRQLASCFFSSSTALRVFFFFTIPSSFYSSFTVFCVLPSDCGPYGLPGVLRRQWMPVHRGSDGNNVGTSAICVCNSHTRGHTDNTKTTRVLTSQLLAFQRGWRFPGRPVFRRSIYSATLLHMRRNVLHSLPTSFYFISCLCPLTLRNVQPKFSTPLTLNVSIRGREELKPYSADTSVQSSVAERKRKEITKRKENWEPGRVLTSATRRESPRHACVTLPGFSAGPICLLDN